MIFKKQKELKGHSAGIYSLAFDGVKLYSGSADGFVARWKLDEGIQDAFAIQLNSPVYSICLLCSNQLLVVGLSTGDLYIFDIEKKIEIKFFQQHKKAIFAITENKVKNQFYTADADGNLSIWNSLTLELLVYLPLDCGKIRRIVCNQTGVNFAIASQDGYIRVFETEFFNEISTFFAHKNGTTSLCFHPKNENQIISAGKDALLKLWEWKTGNELRQIPAHNFSIYDVICSNDGTTIISCSRDKSIKTWKSEDLSFIQKLDSKIGGHSYSVNSICKISKNTFASGSDDKKIIIWES